MYEIAIYRSGKRDGSMIFFRSNEQLPHLVCISVPVKFLSRTTKIKGTDIGVDEVTLSTQMH